MKNKKNKNNSFKLMNSETNIFLNDYHDSVLILENGDFFFGKGFGSSRIGVGELCFNTSLTGYQEIITDPSYSKQILTFTFPHIGNVGTNSADYESSASYVEGIVTRHPPTENSNWRSEKNFNQWLTDFNIPGISGIDTRHLTKIIRKSETINALIYKSKKNRFNFNDLFSILKSHPSMKGLELSSEISTKKKYNWKEGIHSLLKNKEKEFKKNLDQINIVALDFGIKKNILRNLFDRNLNVKILPQNTPFKKIMDLNPCGIFLSNGPGDPKATNEKTLELIRRLINTKIPVFGICIGHQLLALSLGAKTKKMNQGHRGANHPVKNLNNGRVEITSQNHGFEVDTNNLPKNLRISHLSLFDNSIEGIEHKTLPVFSVQFHPESSPGPTDSSYLFDKFYKLVSSYFHAQKN